MFSRNEYFKNMIYNLDSTFDRIYPMGILFLTIMGMFRSFNAPDDFFYWIDLVMALVLLCCYSFRKSLDTSFKASLSAVMATGIGLLSYHHFGIMGTGIPVLIISNLLMIIFSSRKFFKINLIVSAIGLFVITLVRSLNDGFNLMHVYNILLFILLIYILDITLTNIREYLLANIETLDKNVRENETMINELAIQNAAIKSNEKEIYQLAFFDQLTGLAKRNLFEKHVSHRMRQVDRGTMMIVDLKEFKVLNSVYGTEVGDQVLKLVGKVFQEHQSKLYACRLNGNEFALWIEHDDIDFIRNELLLVEQDFRAYANDLFKFNRIRFHVSYVTYPENGQSFSELLNKLIIALNHGKNNESADYIKYESYMEANIQYENKMKRLLEEAILKKSFTVAYQEKYDSKRCEVIGLEALARWQSDSLGFVSPSEFVPMIMKYHMIESFERVIIEKVFEDYKLLIEKYGNISIGINISPDHITAKYFKNYISQAADLYDIDKNNIMLEITEEVMIKGIGHVESVLNNLRQEGFKISLDDFGSGYSSLNYLAKLPFDEIKIDKAFVDQIHIDKVQKVLSTVIELKMIYDVNVIAEGVERQEQLDNLQSIGCYMIQGYLYSKPKPLR